VNLVFGHRQKQQTHRQQFMDELNQGVGALRRAAGHFALGTAEHMGPTYDRARAVANRGWDSTRDTLNPMYHSMRERAMQGWSMGGPQEVARAAARLGGMRGAKAKPKSHGRMRGLVSLLAAGAAVGAAGAAVARRRRNQLAEWEEYDPMTGETRYYGERSRYGDESAYGSLSTRERMASGAASMADSLSDRAGRIADSLHERSAAMHERSGGPSAGPAAHAMPEPTAPTGGNPAGQPNPPSGGGSTVPGTTSRPPGNPLQEQGAPLAFPDER
jgi:hypothetical protein